MSHKNDINMPRGIYEIHTKWVSEDGLQTMETIHRVRCEEPPVVYYQQEKYDALVDDQVVASHLSPPQLHLELDGDLLSLEDNDQALGRVTTTNRGVPTDG